MNSQSNRIKRLFGPPLDEQQSVEDEQKKRVIAASTQVLLSIVKGDSSVINIDFDALGL